MNAKGPVEFLRYSKMTLQVQKSVDSLLPIKQKLLICSTVASKVACLTPPPGIPPYLAEEYHGRISKEEERRKLEGKSGRYLVRESFSNPKLNEYTLAFNFDENIINIKLFYSPSTKTFCTEDSTDKDYKSVLELMTDVLQLFQEMKRKDSTVTEKILSSNDTQKSKKKQHVFKSHFYKHPTWCDKCRHFLWGLYKQGYKCEDCDMNVHKECRHDAPLPCAKIHSTRKFSRESQQSNAGKHILKRNSDPAVMTSPSLKTSFSRCYSESLPSVNEKSGHCTYFKKCARFLSAFGIRDKFVDMNHPLTRCYCMSCMTENACESVKNDNVCDVLKQWTRFHFLDTENSESLKDWEIVYFAIQPTFIEQILRDCYDKNSDSDAEFVVAPSLAYTAQDMINENWSYKFPDTHTASYLYAQTVLEVYMRPGSYVILPTRLDDNSNEYCANVVPERWKVQNISDIYPKALLVKIFDEND